MFADAGYQGADKRLDARPDVQQQVAMRPCKRSELDKENNPIDGLVEKVKKLKASIRAKVEHPFRVVKRQFGCMKVRYRGLRKTRCSSRFCLWWSNLNGHNDRFFQEPK